MKHTHDDDELDTFQPIGLAAARVVNSIKTSEGTECLNFGRSVSSMSFSGRGKSAEEDCPAANSDLSAPTAPCGIVKDAGKTGLVGDGPTVSLVLGGTGLSQVCETVIGYVPIDMVDVASRPPAMDVEPSKAMREIGSAANNNQPAPTLVDRTGGGPN